MHDSQHLANTFIVAVAGAQFSFFHDRQHFGSLQLRELSSIFCTIGNTWVVVFAIIQWSKKQQCAGYQSLLLQDLCTPNKHTAHLRVCVCVCVCVHVCVCACVCVCVCLFYFSAESNCLPQIMGKCWLLLMLMFCLCVFACVTGWLTDSVV